MASCKCTRLRALPRGTAQRYRMQELILIEPGSTVPKLRNEEWTRARENAAIRCEFEKRLEDSGALAFRVARGVLKNDADAEDVAQEALPRELTIGTQKRLLRDVRRIGIVFQHAAGDAKRESAGILEPFFKFASNGSVFSRARPFFVSKLGDRASRLNQDQLLHSVPLRCSARECPQPRTFARRHGAVESSKESNDVRKSRSKDKSREEGIPN